MDIQQHIALAYEIEGLLCLLKSQECDPAKQQQIKSLIASKAETLAVAYASTQAAEPADPAAISAAVDAEIKPIAEPTENAEQDAEPVAEEPIAEVSEQSESATDSERSDGSEDVAPLASQEAENEPIAELGDDAPSAEDEANEPVRPLTDVNSELLIRHAGSLKKAFSLNDTFRFTRELFGNSRSDFNDAIALVEAMADVDEAEEYFYGSLDWDRDNADVKDFMTIVEAYLTVNSH